MGIVDPQHNPVWQRQGIEPLAVHGDGVSLERTLVLLGAAEKLLSTIITVNEEHFCILM